MYETTNANPIYQGTRNVLSTRFPTNAEQRKINVLNKYALTTNLNNLKTEIGNLNNLKKQRENLISKYKSSLKGNLNSEGEFNGTKQDYNKTENLYNKIKINELKIKSIPSTKTESFFGAYKREVPIQDLTKIGRAHV